jgi:hypothetical protein
MPTQTAKDPSAREKIIAVLKDWRVLAGEVLAVGGSFLVGWAPPGHVGGVSSWATGLATGATLVVLIALAGNWPSRPTKVCTTRLRLFVAALALATIGPDCLLWPAAGRAGLHLAGTGQRSGNCTPALYPGRRPHRFWTGRTRHPWSLPRNSGGPGRRPASGGPGGAALDHVVPPVCRQSPHLLVRPDGVRLGSADGQPGAAGRQAVGDPR